MCYRVTNNLEDISKSTNKAATKQKEMQNFQQENKQLWTNSELPSYENFS